MYGEAGKTPMFLLVAVHLPVMVTAATLIVERSLGASASWRALAVKCFGHPIILAILAGALTRLLAIPLPEAAIVPLKLLGDAAPGAALFAMGLSLNLHGFGDNPRLILALSLLKLIAMPALVYALAFHWFALPPVWAGVAVLFAACPVGINSYIIAARFQIGVAETSGTITVSTLLSIFTVTAWVAILQGF